MKKVFLAAAFAALTATASSAAPIYGTAAPLTGARSSPGTLVTAGSWLDDVLEIGWEITQNGNEYTYRYTFTGFGQPDISHVTLDVTDNCTNTAAAAPCLYDIQSSSNVGQIEFGDKDGITGAGKFDFGGTSPFWIQIEGLGDKLVEQLVDAGRLETPADLYSLAVDELARKDVRIGDTVVVRRAGE